MKPSEAYFEPRMSAEIDESLNDAVGDVDLHKVQNILENDPDIIKRWNQNSSHSYNTPCHSAAARGHLDILQLLLNHDANVNMVNNCGNTPLHEAAFQGHVDIVQLLVNYGANVNMVNRLDSTPLHKAAMTSNGAKCIELLLKSGADIKARNNNGQTPFQTALTWNRKECVECFLRNAGNEEITVNTVGIVARRGELDILQLLLDHGANVNVVNTEGDTPLHMAAGEECVKLLLKSGANIKARNGNGETPYQTAIEGERKKAAECLLRNAGNEEDTVNSMDNDGNTSLHKAAARNVDILKFVLNHGANVNVVNSEGDTPLHIASRKRRGKRHVSRIKLLLKFGANIEAKNNNGKTPYQTAIEGKRKKAAECLRNAANGEDVELINSSEDDEEDEELMSSSEDDEEDEELMSSSEGEEEKKYRRAYLEALEEGEAKNNRIPIMLVGQDRAGKTSLMARLQGEPFKKDQPSTIGIGVNVIELTEQNSKEPWRAREGKEFMTSEGEAETAILEKARECFFDSRFQRKLEGDEAEVMPVIAEKPVAPVKSLSIKSVPTEVISKMKTHTFTAQNQEEVLRVFLADFAGQKIYYDTHGCFVKPHCAYVLVHDLSLKFDEPAVPKFKVSEKEKEEEMNNPHGTTNLDNLTSWLKFLQGLGEFQDEDIDKSGPYSVNGRKFHLPPVLIALTHCDEVKDDVSVQDVESRIQKVLGEGTYKNVFPECFLINNTLKGDEEDDIRKLRKQLFDLSNIVLKKEPAMPLNWLRFEAALSKLSRKYISVDEAKKVAENCDIKKFDEAIKFLHRLGAVVYHSGSRQVVLDPPWLMNLFTKVISIPKLEKVDPVYLRDYKVFKKKGILFQEYLREKAQLKDVELLEELMEKFNLISPCQHEERPAFYVPSLAPLMPKKELKASTIPSLFVTFPLQFVPMGLFTKLQVKLISEWEKSFPKQQVKPSFFCNYSMLPLIIDEDVYDVHLIDLHEFIKVTVLPDKPDGNHLTFARHFLVILKKCLDDLKSPDQLLFSMTSYDLKVKCTCCFGEEERCFRHHKTQCDSDRCGHFLKLCELQGLYGDGSSFLFCRSDPRLAKKFDIKTVEIWLNTDTVCSQEPQKKRKKQNRQLLSSKRTRVGNKSSPPVKKYTISSLEPEKKRKKQNRQLLSSKRIRVGNKSSPLVKKLPDVPMVKGSSQCRLSDESLKETSCSVQDTEPDSRLEESDSPMEVEGTAQFGLSDENFGEASCSAMVEDNSECGLPGENSGGASSSGAQTTDDSQRRPAMPAIYLKRMGTCLDSVGLIALKNEDDDGLTYTGTGWLVAKDKGESYVMTNHHVISAIKQRRSQTQRDIKVVIQFDFRTNAQPSCVEFEVKAHEAEIFDENLDYAVLKVQSNCPGRDCLAVSTRLPNLNSNVNVIGHPKAKPKSVMFGEVLHTPRAGQSSSEELRKWVEENTKQYCPHEPCKGETKEVVCVHNYEKWRKLERRKDFLLIHKCGTSQGASGSPVLNDNGEVIALHSWGMFLGNEQQREEPALEFAHSMNFIVKNIKERDEALARKLKFGELKT